MGLFSKKSTENSSPKQKRGKDATKLWKKAQQ